MKIKDMKFVQGFAELCEEGYRKGWHERNGGNISYRLTENEKKAVKKSVKKVGEYADIGKTFPRLSGDYFLVSGSGKYMRHMKADPEDTICIIEINETGDKYRILWGMVNGGRPTSELPTHLTNHEIKKISGSDCRVIYHNHPVNIIALSALIDDDDRVYSNILWRTITECSVVFPDGVGVVPWMVCGSDEIANASAEKMERYNAVVWARHGLFCAGTDFDDAFGLAETVEKSAEIYLKILSAGKLKNNITNEQLIRLADTFNYTLNVELLDD